MKQQIKVKRRKQTTDSKPDRRYFAISASDANGILTLITPERKYVIANNRVGRDEDVRDYDSEVRQAICGLAERALVGGGFYSGEYRIQFNRNEPVRSA